MSGNWIDLQGLWGPWGMGRRKTFLPFSMHQFPLPLTNTAAARCARTRPHSSSARGNPTPRERLKGPPVIKRTSFPLLPRFPKGSRGRTGKQGEPSLAFQFWRRSRIFNMRKRANPKCCEGRFSQHIRRRSQALLLALASAQDYGEDDQPIRAEAPPPCFRAAGNWKESFAPVGNGCPSPRALKREASG